jgi:hypothetical protein
MFVVHKATCVTAIANNAAKKVGGGFVKLKLGGKNLLRKAGSFKLSAFSPVNPGSAVELGKPM